MKGCGHDGQSDRFDKLADVKNTLSRGQIEEARSVLMVNSEMNANRKIRSLLNEIYRVSNQEQIQEPDEG